FPSGAPVIAGAPPTFEPSSDDAGPALAVGTVRGSTDPVWLAWISENQRLHVASSPNGVNFNAPVTLGHRASGDSSPGLAMGNEQIFLSWVDDDNHIHVVVSPDGAHWGSRVDIGDNSLTEGLPALAYGSGK